MDTTYEEKLCSFDTFVADVMTSIRSEPVKNISFEIWDACAKVCADVSSAKKQRDFVKLLKTVILAEVKTKVDPDSNSSSSSDGRPGSSGGLSDGSNGTVYSEDMDEQDFDDINAL